MTGLRRGKEPGLWTLQSLIYDPKVCKHGHGAFLEEISHQQNSEHRKPWKAIPIARLASNLIDDLITSKSWLPRRLYQRFHTHLYEILVDVRWSYLDYIKRPNYWHLWKTLESEGTMKLIAERKTALSWPPTSPFQIACTGIVFGVVFWALLLVLFASTAWEMCQYFFLWQGGWLHIYFVFYKV